MAARDLPVKRSEKSREEAIEFFRGIGEEYKAQIIEDIPAHEQISLYGQEDFIQAKRCYNKALDLDPRNVYAKENLSKLKEKWNFLIHNWQRS